MTAIKFPIMDVSFAKWKRNEEDQILFDEYIYTKKEATFKKYFRNRSYVDSNGDVYKITDRILPGKVRQFFSFIPNVCKVQLVFRKTDKTMTVEEVRDYLLKQLKDRGADDLMLEWIKGVENAKTIEEMLLVEAGKGEKRSGWAKFRIRKSTIIVALILSAFFVGMHIRGLATSFNSQVPPENRVYSNAIVIDTYSRSTGRSRVHYLIYEFSTNGETFQRRARKRDLTLTVGSEIPIVYDRTNPGMSITLNAYDWNENPRSYIVIPASILMAFLLAWAMSSGKKRKKGELKK